MVAFIDSTYHNLLPSVVGFENNFDHLFSISVWLSVPKSFSSPSPLNGQTYGQWKGSLSIVNYLLILSTCGGPI